MRLTRIIARAATGPPDGDRLAVVADAVWAAARPEDRLEHVSVRAGPGDLAIGVFTVDGDEARVRRLIERAWSMSPVLRAWRVTDVADRPGYGIGAGSVSSLSDR